MKSGRGNQPNDCRSNDRGMGSMLGATRHKSRPAAKTCVEAGVTGRISEDR